MVSFLVGNPVCRRKTFFFVCFLFFFTSPAKIVVGVVSMIQLENKVLFLFLKWGKQFRFYTSFVAMFLFLDDRENK